MPNSKMLQLYIVSGTANSEEALANLRRALKQYPDDMEALEVIDLRNNPMQALTDGIVAVPTLQVVNDVFRTRLVGSLSNSTELNRLLANTFHSEF